MAHGRVYGGRSEAERRADRRARLVAAGLELFGTEGWHTASIERLCAEASVATRSFYEEFTGREPLMQAVYDEIVEGTVAAVLGALLTTSGDLAQRVSAGVAAYLRHLTEDPRRARVAHREVRAVGALEQHRHSSLLRSCQVVQLHLVGPEPAGDEARRRVLALALAGALAEVLDDWVGRPEPRPSLEPVHEELTRLFSCALTPLAPARPAPGTVAGGASADA